jgi:cytochrome c553
MKAVAFLAPFVILGVGTLFVAFSGGPGAAREAYLTRGGRFFKVMIVVIFAVGIIVPAAILLGRDHAAGRTESLESAKLNSDTEKGQLLFRQQCASCHTLAAVNAHGVTGPNLDDIGEVTPTRILEAIENGGTGQSRMPARLLEGQDAREVAEYVSQVAGR